MRRSVPQRLEVVRLSYRMGASSPFHSCYELGSLFFGFVVSDRRNLVVYVVLAPTFEQLADWLLPFKGPPSTWIVPSGFTVIPSFWYTLGWSNSAWPSRSWECNGTGRDGWT